MVAFSEVIQALDSGVYKKLWDVAWDQWKHPNAVLHRRDSDRQSILLRDTDQEIRRQYDMGRANLPRKLIHCLLASPMDELLEAAPAVRKQWVASMKEGRVMFRRRQRDDYRSEYAGLRNWLQGGNIHNNNRVQIQINNNVKNWKRITKTKRNKKES